MFGLGVGVVKEAGDDWAGQRVSGVGLTGIVGVKALMAGPWIKAGGFGSSSGGRISRTVGRW